MGRPRNGSELTISQLESLLQSRRSQADLLTVERCKLLKELAIVDGKLRKLGADPEPADNGDRGSDSLTPTGRVRNPQSLVATMREVLTRAGEPMKVIDIVQAVLDAGYRSNSTTFRAIVNQTLIRERKNFLQTARATYDVKK